MKPAFVVSAVVLCLPLAAGDKNAIKRMERAFKPDNKTRDSFVAKQRAIRGLRGVDSADGVKVVVAAYRTLDTELEPIAKERAYVLLNGTSLELARFRKKIDPIHELQDGLLEALDAMSSKEAVDEMLAQLVATPSPPFSLAMRISGRLSGMTKPDILLAALDKKTDPGDKVAMLRVVRSLGPRGRFFGKWVTEQLQATSATVRLEAIQTVAVIRYRDAVAPLIARLTQETGRALDAVADALHDLTGESFGVSPAAWGRWLASRAKPDEEPKKKKGETVVAPPKAKKTVSTYFGLPQEGNSIIYVIDRSDSMNRGTRGGGSRLEKARRELSKAIRELPDTTRFNIVEFAIRVKAWKDMLEPATAQNVAEARAWLRDLDPKAGTSSYDALERAFLSANHRTTDRFHELEVETIFFLSDGEPTRRTGGYASPLVLDDTERILSAVRRWNAAGRVVLHTIGIGLERKGSSTFMKQLAEQNGGRFVAFH